MHFGCSREHVLPVAAHGVLRHPSRCVTAWGLPAKEFLKDRNELFAMWLASEKDVGQLTCRIARKRVASRLGRTDFVAKKRKQIIESFGGDVKKAEIEMQKARRENRHFWHPTFPNDEDEASLGLVNARAQWRLERASRRCLLPAACVPIGSHPTSCVAFAGQPVVQPGAGIACV